jgi:hypothetical protein
MSKVYLMQEVECSPSLTQLGRSNPQNGTGGFQSTKYMSWLTVLTFATKLVEKEVLACYELRAYFSAMVLAQNSFAQPNFIYRHNRGKWREAGDGQRSTETPMALPRRAP